MSSTTQKNKISLHPSQVDIHLDQLVNIVTTRYNLGGYIRLIGTLEKERLIRASDMAFQSFESFKLRFCHHDPHYAFLDDSVIQSKINEIDFSGEKDPHSAASRWVQEQFDSPFELSRVTLLFEQAIIRLSCHEHWFFNKFHHILTDGHGFAIWAQFVARAYSSGCGETQGTTEPSYFNAAAEANKYRDSDKYREDEKYWVKKFEVGLSRLLQPRYSVKGRISSGRKRVSFSDACRDKFTALEAETNSNLLQLSIAALVVYFGKVAGEKRICIGVPIHKRNDRSSKKTFGQFSGYIPFIGLYDPELSLAGVIDNVRKCLMHDYRHQKYLLSDLNKCLRNKALNELFQIVVNYERLNFRLNFGKELVATTSHINSQFDTLPLEIRWSVFGEQQPLELQIDFDRQYFTDAEIELLTNRFLYILEQFGSRVQAPVGEVYPMPPEEQRQLEKEFQPTRTPFPTGSVIGCFKSRVESNPEDIAIEEKDGHYTFRQLNEHSNGLADYLISMGFRRGDRVVICMDRSYRAVVSILGVLKAGGIYVPVDPEIPTERLGQIASGVEAFMLVVDSTRSDTPLGFPILDGEGVLSLPLTGQVVSSITPADHLCIIHTSGSTGRPRSIMISDKAVMNRLYWMCTEFPFSESEKNSLKTSLGFVDHIWELFGALVAGIASVIFTKQEMLNLNAFCSKLNARGVTRLVLVPSFLEVFLDQLVSNGNLPRNLRYVTSSGAVLRRGIAERFFSVFGHTGAVLLNMYGSTEVMADVTCQRVETIDGGTVTPMTVPIGRPVANTRIFISRDGLELCPIGVVGELYIGGDQVSLCYYGNPDINSDSFVNNKFVKGSSLLFKSGDLGRWLPDGTIEYVGRCDNQIKIRGQRLELGEVEHVILDSGVVKKAVVVVEGRSGHEDKLAAFLVPSSGYLRSNLIAYLNKRLPRFMVPSFFCEMDDLPLNTNGKVDMMVLGNFERESEPPRPFVGPGTEMESVVLSVWREVLSIDNVSVDDNFFEIGGHSLSAVKVASLVMKKLRIIIPIGVLYELPTVHQLAKYLDWAVPSEFEIENWKMTVLEEL